MVRFIITNQSRSERVPTPQRRWSRWLVRLAWTALAVAGLMLLGAAYESAAEDADARTYLPPGEMVDIGDYRVHVHCVGTGSPTVVIEAGLGDWSASWESWVQPQVARTTRVCSYDRAGMGYSEPGPLPRTADRLTQELHTALDEARVPGPFVLVGHSLGGLLVRVFAHQYSGDVAGVVLVDSMNQSAVNPPTPNAPTHAGNDSAGDWMFTLPARVGLLRLLAGPLDMSGGMSTEVASAYTAYSVTPRSVQSTLDEGKEISKSLVQAGAVTSFGEAPLVVLSRGLNADENWRLQQADLLHLSSNSRQVIAATSGHNIQLDEPEAVVGAIATVLEQIRQRAGIRVGDND